MRISRRIIRVLPDYLALIAGVCLIDLSFPPSTFFSISWITDTEVDKAAHFAAYAFVGFLVLYRRRKISTSLLTAAVLIYIGGVIELMQSDAHRSTDIADFIANCLGVVFAGLVVALVQLCRESVQRRSMYSGI